MAEKALDGFDHTSYKDEVEQRWGAEAYRTSDAWWRSKSDDEKRAFQQEHLDIARDYVAARADGVDPADARVQAIVRRHVDWLDQSVPSTGRRVTPEVLLGYGDMYVADERFAANYGGTKGAEYVRDAFRVFAADGE